jgi:hypothetical protein
MCPYEMQMRRQYEDNLRQQYQNALKMRIELERQQRELMLQQRHLLQQQARNHAHSLQQVIKHPPRTVDHSSSFIKEQMRPSRLRKETETYYSLHFKERHLHTPAHGGPGGGPGTAHKKTITEWYLTRYSLHRYKLEPGHKTTTTGTIHTKRREPPLQLERTFTRRAGSPPENLQHNIQRKHLTQTEHARPKVQQEKTKVVAKLPPPKNCYRFDFTCGRCHASPSSSSNQVAQRPSSSLDMPFRSGKQSPNPGLEQPLVKPNLPNPGMPLIARLPQVPTGISQPGPRLTPITQPRASMAVVFSKTLPGASVLPTGFRPQPLTDNQNIFGLSNPALLQGLASSPRASRPSVAADQKTKKGSPAQMELPAPLEMGKRQEKLPPLDVILAYAEDETRPPVALPRSPRCNLDIPEGSEPLPGIEMVPPPLPPLAEVIFQPMIPTLPTTSGTLAEESPLGRDSIPPPESAGYVLPPLPVALLPTSNLRPS